MVHVPTTIRFDRQLSVSFFMNSESGYNKIIDLFITSLLISKSHYVNM